MHRRAVLALVVIAVLALVTLYAGEGRLTGAGSGRGLGCALHRAPAEGRVVPLIANCTWPVPAAQLHKLLADLGRHDSYFSNLSESSVLDHRDGVTRVRQVHRAPGMTDREVIVDWRVRPVAHGARYVWRKSSDQSSVDSDRIEVEETRGFWEIRGDGKRTHVRYEVRYLPGGGLPLFLLRLFMSSGMKAVLGEIRDAADATVVATQQVDHQPPDARRRGDGESDTDEFSAASAMQPPQIGARAGGRKVLQSQ